MLHWLCHQIIEAEVWSSIGLQHLDNVLCIPRNYAPTSAPSDKSCNHVLLCLSSSIASRDQKFYFARYPTLNSSDFSLHYHQWCYSTRNLFGILKSIYGILPNIPIILGHNSQLNFLDFYSHVLATQRLSIYLIQVLHYLSPKFLHWGLFIPWIHSHLGYQTI